MRWVTGTKPTAAQWSGVMWAAAIALLITVIIGAWWTTSAAFEGQASTMLLRFGLTILLATYYFVWFQNARSALENRRLVQALTGDGSIRANATAEDIIRHFEHPTGPPVKQ